MFGKKKKSKIIFVGSDEGREKLLYTGTSAIQCYKMFGMQNGKKIL